MFTKPQPHTHLSPTPLSYYDTIRTMSHKDSLALGIWVKNAHKILGCVLEDQMGLHSIKKKEGASTPSSRNCTYSRKLLLAMTEVLAHALWKLQNRLLPNHYEVNEVLQKFTRKQAAGLHNGLLQAPFLGTFGVT